MKTMYRARFGEITPVEVSAETQQFITLSGHNHRTKKRTDWENYFDTQIEAQDCLIGLQQRKVSMAEAALARENKELAKLKERFGLTPAKKTKALP